MRELRTLSVAFAVTVAVLLPGPALGESALRRSRAAQPSRATEHAAQLSSAAEHFRAGRFAAARGLFDALLASDATLRERASIAFNAAVSSYALEEYRDALRRFQEVERAYPELRALAGLNAGFAALRAGELELAEGYARDAQPLPDDLDVRREKLRVELAEAREQERTGRREQQLDAGFAAIVAQRWQPAREHLTLALANSQPGEQEALADAHYGLGLIAAELGQLQPAREHFEHSLQQRPRDARTLLALAHAAEQGADPQRAERAYESALALPLEPAEQRDTELALLRLYPLPRGGPAAYVALGAGVDGNATQSGSGDLLAAGASDSQASAYASALAELSVALRTSRRSALGLSYTGDMLALLRPSVAELSLQAHELLARWHWAPAPGVRWRLDAGGAYVLAGLDPVRSFEWDGVLGITLDIDTSARSRARLQLGERLVHAAELSYLDGHRLHLLATELWSLGSWELTLLGALRYVSAGTERVALASDAFDACSPSCDQRRYQNPFGYWSPGFGGGVGWQALERLRFGSQVRAEYRGYQEPSLITGIPDSRKTRQDLRVRAQLGAELSLDDAGRFRVTLDQTLLASRSNMAWDPGDPSHQYDYGDRNFVQPTTELGVSASFP